MNGPNIPSTTPIRPNTKTPYQLPAATLAIYPAILVLGSLFSLISPTARPTQPEALPSPNTAVTDGNRDQGPINYFARKGNIFNVYFVKIGWIWTTAAFLSLLWVSPAFNSRRVDVNCRIRRVWQALFRYALVTLSWVVTTQWCFGPAIIDRCFVFTGGKCHIPSAGDTTTISPNWKPLLTAASCKANGGTWKGGHDVSGHVFMLAVASAFLVFEFVGSIYPAVDEQETKNKECDPRVSAGDAGDTRCEATKWPQHFITGVVGLSLWMLLMTGIWFHTWLEKVSCRLASSGFNVVVGDDLTLVFFVFQMTGLLIALGTIYAVYILPRTLESWQNIVGLPGL